MSGSSSRLHRHKWVQREGRINRNISWCKREIDDSNSLQIQIIPLTQELSFQFCPSGSESEFEGVREPTKLCVGNLPLTATREDVEQFFAETATVTDVQFAYTNDEDGRLVQLGALVEFDSNEDAREAKKLNGALMGNANLYITCSRNNRRVFFVKGFDVNDTQQQMVRKMEKRFEYIGGYVWKTYFPPNERFAYALVELEDSPHQETVARRFDCSTSKKGIFVRLAELKKRFGQAHMSI